MLLTAQRLLRGGATVDDQVLDLMVERYKEGEWESGEFENMMAMIDTTEILAGEESRARALQCALESQVSAFSSLLQITKLIDGDRN